MRICVQIHAADPHDHTPALLSAEDTVTAYAAVDGHDAVQATGDFTSQAY